MKRSIKRWNLKKIFVIAGVAAMVAGFAGCGGTKKDADKTTEINVGYFNNVTHAQALYMKAQGTLDKCCVFPICGMATVFPSKSFADSIFEPGAFTSSAPA